MLWIMFGRIRYIQICLGLTLSAKWLAYWFCMLYHEWDKNCAGTIRAKGPWKIVVCRDLDTSSLWYSSYGYIRQGETTSALVAYTVKKYWYIKSAPPMCYSELQWLAYMTGTSLIVPPMAASSSLSRESYHYWGYFLFFSQNNTKLS